MAEPAQASRETPVQLDDLQTIADLREAFERTEYSAEGILDALGVGDSVRREIAELPHYLRRLPETSPRATIIKLFWLRTRVDAAEAAEALAPASIERLVAMGVLEERGSEVSAPIEILPAIDLYITSDWHGDELVGESSDHVLGVSPPTAVLARLTIRNHVPCALDLGTGNGFQALTLSKDADRVVATDVNPRALGFARFNSLLNEIENVEWRAGSLFEPVEGETFDLIVSNPPYVVSPDSGFAFRDGGLAGDSFCETLVRGAPAHLNEGAFAHLLISWINDPDYDWSVRVRDWVEGNGCDAFLLHVLSYDPLTYAVLWNRPIRSNLPLYEETIDRWLAYFREEGIREISFGALFLRRRTGDNWFFAQDYASYDHMEDDAGRHVRGLFEAQDFVRATSYDELLDQRFELPPELRLQHVARFHEGDALAEGAVLLLNAGLRFKAGADPFTLDLVSALGAGRTTREALTTLGDRRPEGVGPKEFEAAAENVTRRLTELGFLLPRSG